MPFVGRALGQSAESGEYDEDDLTFNWSDDRKSLRVDTVTISHEENKTPPIVVAWHLQLASFGPGARANLARKPLQDGLKVYELKVRGVELGALRNRTIRLLFTQHALRAAPDKRPQLRFGLHAISDVVSRSGRPDRGDGLTLHELETGSLPNALVDPHQFAVRPVLWTDFLDGASLRQTITAARASATLAGMFGGLAGFPADAPYALSRAEYPIHFGFDKDASFTFDASALSRRRKPYAILPELRLDRVRVYWSRPAPKTDAQGEFARPPDVFRADATLAADTPALQIPSENERTLAFKLEKRAGSETPLIRFRSYAPEGEADLPAGQRRVYEAALSWTFDDVTIRAGNDRPGQFGPLPKLVGRLYARSYSTLTPGAAVPALGNGRLSFHGDFADSNETDVESPIGNLRLRGPARAEGEDGIVPPEAFAPRSGAAVQALLRWGALPSSPPGPPTRGTPSRPWLDWFEATALMVELDAALPDAESSRLTFAPTEVQTVFAADGLVHSARSSLIRLDDDADEEVARIDLARAMLKASRTRDLLSLGFRFSNLHLVFARGRRPELVSGNTACFVPPVATDGQASIRSASDQRPILVVEFPPQHVLEEAVFLPKTPPLPDVELDLSVRCYDARSGKRVDCPPDIQRPLALQVDAQTIRLDPNNRVQIVEALAQLPNPAARVQLRRDLRELKRAAASDMSFAAVADGLKIAASHDPIPPDQRVYIGPFALDPDAAKLAREALAGHLRQTAQDMAVRMMKDVERARAEIIGRAEEGDPREAPVLSRDDSLSGALALESRIEAVVPTYQLFRNFYREWMLRRASSGEPASATALSAEGLEFVHLSEGAPLPAWAARAGLTLAGLRAARTSALNEFVAKTLAFDVMDVLDAATESGLVEGRLSRPTRLAFRVPCRDGVEAARLDQRGLDHGDGEASLLPRDRLAFELCSLTNFAAFEMAVTRRAELVYSPDQAGRLGRRHRRIDASARGRLAHLGFRSGEFVTAAARLSDIATSLAEPPGPLETAIEIPARLILSPHQEAVVLTPHEPPEGLFDLPTPAPSARSALWAARFSTEGAGPGLRAVHSPDLRPDFVWQRLHRLGFNDPGGARLPGGGAPPRGPHSPWLLDRSETAEALVSPRALADPYRSEDPAVASALEAAADDETFCATVAAEAARPSGRLALPYLVDVLCARLLRRSGDRGPNMRFRAGLDAHARHELVLLTSAWGLPVVGRRDLQGRLAEFSSQLEPERADQIVDVRPGAALYAPPTLDVTELTLTALGGSLRLDSSFEPPAGALFLDGTPLYDALSVERWQQWSVLGRDIYCEVVYRGFLMPFGHRAALVQLTERTLLSDRNGAIRATLRQRLFIRIGRPEKTFPAIDHPHQGRMFPAARVKMLTSQTPDIVDPTDGPSAGASAGELLKAAANGRLDLGARGLPGLAFWVRTAPSPAGNLRFAVEIDGGATDLPMIFVDNTAANDPASMKSIATYYNGLPNPESGVEQQPFEPLDHVRTIALAGMRIRYAPELEAGSASLETDLWTIGISGRATPSTLLATGAGEGYSRLQLVDDNHRFDPILQGADQPPFYPRVDTARLRLRQAERLLGRPLSPVRAQFEGRYILDGLPETTGNGVVSGNASELFLTLVDQLKQDMDVRGDLSGGVYRPSGHMVALSRRRGILTFDRRLPIADRPAPALFAGLYDFDEPSRPPATSAASAQGTATSSSPAKRSVDQIYASLFDQDAKLLGIVRLKDLVAAAKEVLADPRLGMPELDEKLRYGANLVGGAVGEATAALDLARQRVILPLAGATSEIRKGWDELEADLAASHRRAFGRSDIRGDPITPVTIAEILPELDQGLRGLDRALSISAAETDSIAFALSLGAVYEAGRRFLDALAATAANPFERVEAALSARFLEIRRLLNDSVDALETALPRLLPVAADELLLELREWLVEALLPEDGNDDAHWDIALVALPGFAPRDLSGALTAAEQERIAAALDRLQAALRLRRSDAREVLSAFLEHMLDRSFLQQLEGGNIPGALASRARAFFVAATGEPSTTPGTARIAGLIRDRRDEAAAALDDLGQTGTAAFRRRVAELHADLETFIARFAEETLVEAGTWVGEMLHETIGDELDKLVDVFRHVREIQTAADEKDLPRAIRGALGAVAVFTGPIDVTSAALCARLDAQLEPLRRLIALIDLDGLTLSGPTRTPGFCRLENGLVSAAFEPIRAADDPTPDTASLTGRLYSAQTALTLFLETSRESDLDLALADAAGRIPAGLQDEFAVLRNEIMLTKARSETALHELRTQTAGALADLINDAAVARDLEARLKSVEAVDLCGSDALAKLAELEELPRDLGAFLRRRKSLLESLAKRSQAMLSAIEPLLTQGTLLTVGTAASAAIIAELADLSALERLKDDFRSAENAVALALARHLGALTRSALTVIDKGTELALALRSSAAFSDIARFIDLGAFEASLGSLQALRGTLDGLNNALNATPAPSLAKIGALLREAASEARTIADQLAAPGNLFAPLLAEIDGRIDLLVANLHHAAAEVEDDAARLEELAKAAFRRAEARAIASLDGVARTALLSTVVPGQGGPVSIVDFYANVLGENRERLINEIGNVPLARQIIGVLLVDPRDSRIPTDGYVPYLTGSGSELGPRNDKLAGDIAWLRRAATGRPIADAETRDFLERFLLEWAEGQATPWQVFRQGADVLRKLLSGDFLRAIDFAAIREAIEDELKSLIPREVSMRYGFGLPLTSQVSDKTDGVFRPGAGTRLDIETRMTVKLGGGQPEADVSTDGRLGPFDIRLVGDDFDAVTLRFAGASFTAGSGKKSRFDIDFLDVEIGEKLKFVQKLQKFLAPKPGSGPFVLPSAQPPAIEAGYKLSLGTLSIGTASFFNVSLQASALLPFDGQPALFRAALSSRRDPFTISYLPFGGSGFFSLTANPDGIVGFEASFEFGGAGAFGFGPLSGQGRLMTGVYIRQLKIEGRSRTEITGTFFVGGSASIWIFSFGASLYVRLGMLNGNMTGRAVFTFSFSSGIKDFEYSVTAYRTQGEGFEERAAFLGNGRGGTRFAQIGEAATLPDTLGDDTAQIRAAAVCQGADWGRYRSYFAPPQSRHFEDLLP